MSEAVLRLFAGFDAPEFLPKAAADQAQLDMTVNGIFFIAGAIAVVFVILSAVKFIYSNGNSGRVNEGREGILYSVVGVVVVLVSFAVVQVIMRVL